MACFLGCWNNLTNVTIIYCKRNRILAVHGAYNIADSGGFFEVEAGCGFLHLAFQIGEFG